MPEVTTRQVQFGSADRSPGGVVDWILVLLVLTGLLGLILIAIRPSVPSQASILTSHWPSAPTRSAVPPVLVVIGIGAAILAFARFVRVRRRSIAFGLAGVVGLLAVQRHLLPGPLIGGVMNVLALAGALTCIILLVRRRTEDSIFPIAALCVGLVAEMPFIPLSGHASRTISFAAWGAIAGWILCQPLRLKGVATYLGVVAMVTFGMWFSWRSYQQAVHSFYGFHISFDCVQLGDIDGDGLTDLATCGYHNMVAGSLAWHRGNGHRFDAWSDRELDVYGGGRLLDLDADGDSDLLSAEGIYRNVGGKFTLVAAAGEFPSGKSLFQQFIFSHGQGFIIEAADLTGDGVVELVILGVEVTDPYASGSRGRGGLLGVRSDDFASWHFHSFGADPGVGVEYQTDGGGLLLLGPMTKEQHRDQLTRLGVRYELLPEVPISPEGANRIEDLWRDLDNDGRAELVRCIERESDAPGETIAHFGGFGTFPQLTCKVEVYRRTESALEMVSTFVTSPYICSFDAGQLPTQQLGDIDGDGRVDFLAQDGGVHLQQGDLTFRRVGSIKLANDDRMARLTLWDFDGDGNLDIVSSFQPFWNFERGPLWPR